MNALKCVVTHNEAQCTNGTKTLHNGVFKVKLEPGTNHVVFQHTVGVKVICDGNMFQTFVWGNTATSIWSTDSTELTCLALRDIYLDECEGLYVLTSEPSPDICEIASGPPIRPSSILFITPEQRFSEKLRNIIVISSEYPR